jgi:hypothetical protein
MTLKEAIRALALAQRERDSLREVNCKLRDYLLARAKECEACDGCGVVTVYTTDIMNDPGHQEPCGDCYALREVLGA